MIRNDCYLLVFILNLILLNLDCGLQSSGVETTNGTTVVVCKDKVEGTAPPFANIYLFNADYIPYIDTGLGVVTASNVEGYYSFNSVKLEALSVTVISNDKSGFALLSANYQDSSYRANLQMPGSLQGTVYSSDTGTVLVFLYGTGYYVLLKESGPFVLNDLPAGKYKIQAARILKRSFPGKPVIGTKSEVVQVVIDPQRKTIISEIIIP